MGRRPNRSQLVEERAGQLQSTGVLLECPRCSANLESVSVLLKSVHGSWVGGQIAHSLAEERARFLGRRQIAHSLAEERARFLGRRPNRSATKSLTALPKSVHGSWVGGQIAHSLAEERARFLGRRPNPAAHSDCLGPKSVTGSWVGGQIAHSLAEERARFFSRRPNRSQPC